jgi:hypothetical protein
MQCHEPERGLPFCIGRQQADATSIAIAQLRQVLQERCILKVIHSQRRH